MRHITTEEDIRFCTESVKAFILTDGKEFVISYLKDREDKGKKPSYSDLLLVLNGTTREGVNLASTKVKRGEITQLLLSMSEDLTCD